jgi:uncharacterized OB-fold protein
MPYLPAGFAVPPFLPHELGFAEGCRVRELRLQRCADCGRFRQPPAPRCAHCRSNRADWTAVSGRGEIFTFTIVRHAANPVLREALPYNVIVVLLEGTEGVRLVSNLIDLPPEQIRIGQRVVLHWDLRGAMPLPCFQLDPDPKVTHG